MDLTIVAGPTASGKTNQSLRLARSRGAIILSADSRMVYQGLDIGSGKPTWEYRTLSQSPYISPKRNESTGPVYEVEGVEHFLLDCVGPEQSFSLADWLERARMVLADADRRGQPVVVVGGTGLYLKALLEGYVLPPTDAATRRAIEQMPDNDLQAELKRVDPATADREVSNRRRLVRALEIYKLTGEPASRPRKLAGYPAAKIIICEVSRADLFRRIDERLLYRLGHGMVEETNALLASGVSSTWLESLGLEYRAISQWLRASDSDQQKLFRRLQKDIRAYARRQETFLRTQIRPLIH